MKTSSCSRVSEGAPSHARSARAAGLLLLAFVCGCDFGGSDEDAGSFEFDANFAFDAPSYSYDAGGSPHDAGAHHDAGPDGEGISPDMPDSESAAAEAGPDAGEMMDATASDGAAADATVEAGAGPHDAAPDVAAHDATVVNLDAGGSPDVGADVGTVVIPPAVTLTLSGFPTQATAGATASFTVAALNAAGGPATSYRGTVHCTSSALRSTLPANYTFTAGDEGVHTLTADLATAGTQTLTCTDVANESLSGSETVTVTAGAAANVAVSGGNTQTGLVGTALADPLGVLVTDVYGNAVSGAEVTWTSTTGGGSLAAGLATTTAATGADGATTVTATLGSAPGTDTFAAAVAGVQTSASFSETALATVTISPNPVTTVVGHGVTFAAAGGTGTGYVFALPPTSTGAINPATGVYVAGTTPGTDTVLVTDSAGDPGSAQVIINPHVAFSVTSLAVQPRGAATLAASGGIGPYTFGFASTGNRSGGSLATSGAYAAGAPDESAEYSSLGEIVDNAIVTDSLGDTATLQIKVTAGPVIAPWGMELTSADSFCFGTLLGRTSSGFHASGGSGAGYTFSLSANASGATINATDGCYTPGTNGANVSHVTDWIQVTDSLGNVYGGTTVDVVNTTGTRMIPTAATISENGGFRIGATGGTGPYTFSASTNESGGAVNTGSIGILSTGTSWVSGGNGRSTTTEVDTILVTDTGCSPTTFCLSGLGTAVVTPGPSLSPSAVSVYPGDPVTFVAYGGAFSGYVYSIGANNSGASMDATAGTYIAGATPGMADSVGLVDGDSGTSVASVSVLARPAGLTLSPASATIPPNGALILRGGSGTPPYRFSVTSGDFIDPSSGYFHANATQGSTVTVTVTDAQSRTATALVTVGAPLVAQSSTASITSGETTQLTATGGAASDHEWQMVTNNSGGFVGRNTGIYQGGCAQGSGTVTDTVRVTDFLGNTATTSIAVTCEIIQ